MLILIYPYCISTKIRKNIYLQENAIKKSRIKDKKIKKRGYIINRMTYPLLKNGGYLLSHYAQYHRRGEA